MEEDKFLVYKNKLFNVDVQTHIQLYYTCRSIYYFCKAFCHLWR